MSENWGAAEWGLVLTALTLFVGWTVAISGWLWRLSGRVDSHHQRLNSHEVFCTDRARENKEMHDRFERELIAQHTETREDQKEVAKRLGALVAAVSKLTGRHEP